MMTRLPLPALLLPLLLCQCQHRPTLHTNPSTDPKIIAQQSAAADARWALREQARERLDPADSLSPELRPIFDKGYASGLRDQRAGRPRDPFREDEGGMDKATREAFEQGYDAGYEGR
jgi:hypothetical protein